MTMVLVANMILGKSFDARYTECPMAGGPLHYPIAATMCIRRSPMVC